MSSVEDCGDAIRTAAKAIPLAELVAAQDVLEQARQTFARIAEGTAKLGGTTSALANGQEHLNNANSALRTACHQADVYLAALGLAGAHISGTESSPERRKPPLLTGSKLTESFRRWRNGERVRSESEQVDTMSPLTAEELAELKRNPGQYEGREWRELDRLVPRTAAPESFWRHLTPAQKDILVRKLEEFQSKVNAGCDARGIPRPKPGEITIIVGRYHRQEDGWHVDTRRRPTARVVATLGEVDATWFSHGDTQQSDADYSSVREEADVSGKGFTVHNYGPGAVSLFPADYGWHCPPPKDVPPDKNFRIFFTCDIPIPASPQKP